MKRETWLVAVGAGRWQVPGICAARSSGLKVLAVDRVKSAPGFAMADRALVAEIRDAAAVITAVEASGIRPAGAIAFCNEAGMCATAALREHFDLPGARSEVTRALTNKGVQRARWSRAGLPCPLWFIVRCADQVPAVLGKIKGTAIFKPVDSAGSRGVTVVRQGCPWQKAFQIALEGSLSGEVIIESFIVGIEHTVETFSHRGRSDVLAITAKKKVPGTSNTVAYELASAQLSPAKRTEASNIVIRALAALDYTDGPGHTEFLLTDNNEIRLVESAGRGGGFMVADGVVPLTSGFDLSRACALQAVGSEPGQANENLQKSVVLRFLPSRLGRVVSVLGFEPADEVCRSLVAKGQELGKASSDGDRMAFILAAGNTLCEALEKADLRQKRIKIEVR